MAAQSSRADGTDAACQQILNDIVAEHPTNYRDCTYTIAEADLRECPVPTEIISGRVSSHMILAIDASGSMAGQLGGRTKMDIAKQEALAFLRDMPTEVAVGLVVYGHKGSNQEAGKAESCAASEMIHTFDTSRRDLENTVADLSPTGYTPLAGALDLSGRVIADLGGAEDDTFAPVIYMLSDGEETCDGDPVAAAARLYGAGVKTVVNTIGFDVDAETAAQLQGIADAAGGLYYPADTAEALRDQLRAIQESEAAVARYEYCVNLNEAAVVHPYRNAQSELAQCFNARNPQHLSNALMRAARQDGISESCAAHLQDYAINEVATGAGLWNGEQVRAISDQSIAALEAYREETDLEEVMAAQ